MLREYGVDLRDLFSEVDPVSPKRALVLIENLPIECRSVAAMRDSEDSFGWRVDTWLLASLIDAVRENTHVNMQVRTKKRLKPPAPVHVPGKQKGKPVNKFVSMAQAAFRDAR